MREMLFLSCLCFFACASFPTTKPVLEKEVLDRSFYQVTENAASLQENLPLVFNWQKREKESAAVVEGDVASLPYPHVLQDEYNSFSRPVRRALANKAVVWIQEISSRYYRHDALDEWPTTNELFASTGDDCDGLELIVYTFLLDHGFDERTIFRAIIWREGYRHMVTLWFEDGSDDPWVLDPTGVASPKEPRKLSSLPEWTLWVMFNREESYVPSKPVY